MKNSTVLTDNLMYVPADIFPSISRYIINKEDVYITVAGTIGAVGTIPPELDGANLTENADRLVFTKAASEKSRLFLFAVFCRHPAHGLRGFIPVSAGTASASCRSASGTPCRNRRARKTPAIPAYAF